MVNTWVLFTCPGSCVMCINCDTLSLYMYVWTHTRSLLYIHKSIKKIHQKTTTTDTHKFSKKIHSVTCTQQNDLNDERDMRFVRHSVGQSCGVCRSHNPPKCECTILIDKNNDTQLIDVQPFNVVCLFLEFFLPVFLPTKPIYTWCQHRENAVFYGHIWFHFVVLSTRHLMHLYPNENLY